MASTTAPDLLIRRIRRAAEARVCAEIMAGSEPWITLRRTREFALARLQDPTREVYVAVVEGQLAGFIILHLGGPFRGYLQTIAVAPEFRNRGIGRQLIAFTEERIFRECPNVFLCVSSFNPGAQRFYARLGYEPVGTLKDYVVKGHSEILMRKTISPMADFQPRAKA